MNSAIKLARLAIELNGAARTEAGTVGVMAELATEVLIEEGVRYWLSPAGDSITCAECRMTSHNANDIKSRYCGHCHVFLDELGVGQHRLIHARLHLALDALSAGFLTHKRGKMPSTTTLMELMEWSYWQTIDPAPPTDATR